MTSKMHYLDEPDGLGYFVRPDSVELWNLKELDGMQVAELITYLQDDGFVRCGEMFANEKNGSLTMLKL